MSAKTDAVTAAHRAICEDSLAECMEWEGRCVQAVEAASPHILRGWLMEDAATPQPEEDPS